MDGLEPDEENFESYEEKKGANGTVFMVRERLINDFYEHEPTDLQESSTSQSTSQTFYPEDDKFDNCQIFQNPNVEDFLQHEIKFSEQSPAPLPVESVKERKEQLTLDLNKDEGDEDDGDDETPTTDSVTPTTPNKTLAGAANGNAAAKKKKRKPKNKKK